MQHAFEGSLPVHRVRFDAPATLTFSGYAETFAMAVTSLSVHGVGCSGPEGLVLGDRLQLAFSLGPEEAPTDFPCEVIWVEPAEEGEALYGMRFVGLTQERESRLAGLLAERGGHDPLEATAERTAHEEEGAGESEVAEAVDWDMDTLAAYGLEGTNPVRRHTGAVAHHATDLDAAIAEQTRRPHAAPVHLTTDDSFDVREAPGHTSEESDRLLHMPRQLTFWVGLVVGLMLGGLAGAGFVGASRGVIAPTLPVEAAPSE